MYGANLSSDPPHLSCESESLLWILDRYSPCGCSRFPSNFSMKYVLMCTIFFETAYGHGWINTCQNRRTILNPLPQPNGSKQSFWYQQGHRQPGNQFWNGFRQIFCEYLVKKKTVSKAIHNDRGSGERVHCRGGERDLAPRVFYWKHDKLLIIE